ncbi:MAG TPA: putative ABC exporter domain-containing protein [Oscillospiraceae bacterium]|nr:putative ABC exporter domain-containing protein [Oscillospiraceae bacterium]
MSSIVFLMKKQIKNSLIEMIHHPSKLIAYIFIIAMLSTSIITTSFDRPRATSGMDIRLLQGSYFVILLFIAVLTLLNGLKSGTTFFSMCDVNFLFVSPLSPKRILAYGLIKQMGSSLLVMFFLLFYGASLVNTFKISWTSVTLLVVGMAVLLFVVQVLALLIYSFTNGRPNRITAVKGIIYGLVTLLLLYLGQQILTNGYSLESVYKAISSPQLMWFPVAGWIMGAVFGVIGANVLNTAVYTLVIVAVVAVALLLFIKSDTDYYEDVLQSTESTYQIKQAKKDGNFDKMSAMNGKTTKVHDTGINQGWGANTFFYKHLREAKRKSRLIFVNGSTVILLLATVAVSIFISKISGDDHDPVPVGMLMAIATGMAVYIQFFLNAAGDWTRELMKPAIYLVPEKPFAKLLWASMTTILKPVIDGVIIFTVLCFVLHANPLTAIVCALIYGSTGFLFTANNVLSQRLFGSVSNRGLLMFVYMLILVLTVAPGVVCSALLVAFGNGLPGIVVGLPVVIWNVIISIVIFAACRNILDNVELNY